MKPYLEGLNDAQQEAAQFKDGYQLIIAGAGTGKTKTLVSRVACLLDNGVSGEQILLLTFTNKAADEMKHRIVDFIGDEGTKVTALTFHSFAARMLRTLAPFVDLPCDFTIIDEADASVIMQNSRARKLAALKDQNVVVSEFPTVKKLFAVNSEAVDYQLDVRLAVASWASEHPADEEVFDVFAGDIGDVLEDYALEKAVKHRLDYDDLLAFFHKALCNPKVRSIMADQYRYVMCDEYQDTNHIQDAILNKLTDINGNLVVVGDDNQSIYEFRGAVVENILTFSERHGDCGIIKLTENYRSSQGILDLCNAVMSHATEGIEKTLVGQTEGRKPGLFHTRNDAQTAEWVVQNIVNAHEGGLPYKEMAVIMRNAVMSAQVERLLVKQKVPFKKFGGLKFLERRVILYLLAMIRVMLHQEDDIAWLRILEIIVGVGSKTGKKIADGIADNGYGYLVDACLQKKRFGADLTELHACFVNAQGMSLQSRLEYFFNSWYTPMMKKYISTSNMQDDTKEQLWADLRDSKELAYTLVDMAAGYRTVQTFLDDLVLDKVREKDMTDYVNLTTIHSAKGLEYTTVYLLNPVEGIFPKTAKYDAEDAEELRCLYVALTRAKQNLYIYLPESVRMYDRIVVGQLSHHMDYSDVLACLEEKDVRGL